MRVSDAKLKDAGAEVAIELNETKNNQARLRERLGSLALRVGLLILVCFVVFGVVFGLKRMPTALMQPSIMEGDLLLYYRMDRDFQVGDVVIAEHNDEDVVFRIVAMEGQMVEVTEKGDLLVDGYPEAIETYYKTATINEGDIEYPYRVEEGKVFLVGDYREAVNDSRKFGAVEESKIKGKIIGRFQVRNI